MSTAKVAVEHRCSSEYFQDASLVEGGSRCHDENRVGVPTIQARPEERDAVDVHRRDTGDFGDPGQRVGLLREFGENRFQVWVIGESGHLQRDERPGRLRENRKADIRSGTATPAGELAAQQPWVAVRMCPAEARSPAVSAIAGRKRKRFMRCPREMEAQINPLGREVREPRDTESH